MFAFPYPLDLSLMSYSEFMPNTTSSFSSVDLIVPCSICIAVDNGFGASRWREAVMKEEHLKSKMPIRLRLHTQKEHGLKARQGDAEKVREHGKKLLCPFLHTRKIKDSSSEVILKFCFVC